MMNRTLTRLIAPAAVVAVLIGAAACDEVGATQRDSRTLPLNGATTAEVRIEMGAGNLDIDGGSRGAADIDLAYNIDDWQPKVDWEVTGEHGTLTVRQPNDGGVNLFDIDEVTYDWDIALNEDVPTSLRVDVGAGRSRLDVGGLNLTDLDVDTGAGETTIDFTGEWTNDLDASIDGGAGRTTLRLPRDIGVRIDTDTGLVDGDTNGLHKQDGAWVNDAYGESDVTLTIDLRAGVGSVNLELE